MKPARLAPASLPSSGSPQTLRSCAPSSAQPAAKVLAKPTARPSSRPPSRPVTHPGTLRSEQRRYSRFDKAFPVAIRSEVAGELSAVARNVSAGGIMVEMATPLPLGSRVQVFFSMPDSHARIVAHGEVKNHYFLNFAGEGGAPRAMTGMGIRFSSFESDGDLMLGLGVTRLRTLLH